MKGTVSKRRGQSVVEVGGATSKLMPLELSQSKTKYFFLQFLEQKGELITRCF
jgi:hypothetical protein